MPLTHVRKYNCDFFFIFSTSGEGFIGDILMWRALGLTDQTITRAMQTIWEGGPLTLGRIQSEFFLMRGGDSELQKK